MIHFFGNPSKHIYAVQTQVPLQETDRSKLTWLFDKAPLLSQSALADFFVGPRANMITPWSTNAVEITQNMGIEGILRIEEFRAADEGDSYYDPMLFEKYEGLDQHTFTIKHQPEPVREIEDISAYNQQEGLALSEEEIVYLQKLAQRLGRRLTDSEVFGFSQVNSEHCRHKIFNGTFVIDGEEKPLSLFKLIKKTSSTHPNSIISAYKDNVAFIQGPVIEQFAPKKNDVPDCYCTSDFDSVISLKAETHNFPTTVEPFNGAATGSGGEIRDRLAGGKGSLPLAGTAVYMTPYSRLEASRSWEKALPARPWLYQTPMDILIKASNGTSDFGNKYGQPLITGSVFTFEHEEEERVLGYDKVIMLAGGVGYGKKDQSKKGTPRKGDQIVVLGGDNYRIGMGGAAVSSADTGKFGSNLELNAVQRSNPEMQKRVANTIRAMVESDENLIVSVHDHGAGGHLNCLSELVEETGGVIDMDKLPIGDPTLTAKELIGNESQERMGLVIRKEHIDHLRTIAERERTPMYEVGVVTGDGQFTFQSSVSREKPMDLALSDMFGSSPKTIMNDTVVKRAYKEIRYNTQQLQHYLEQLLQLEAVGCKDWLTNKVDRCVTGRVAKQQCAGPLQLPLNNCGVMALDYRGKEGVATAVGHSPISGLIDPVAGARNSIAEALTNLVWAPLKDGLESVSLSANWMWPCRNEGEDTRLYQAVQACSDFAIALGINIPTGKDSLSMKQKYPKGEVLSPGTVIISAAGHCDDITRVVEPVLQKEGGSLYYIDLSADDHHLGGSSFAQICNAVGTQAPSIKDAATFKKGFNTLQELIRPGSIHAGHDVSGGGLITTLLEMCFADKDLGADIDLTALGVTDTFRLLFSEKTAVVIQADPSVESILKNRGVPYTHIGEVKPRSELSIKNADDHYTMDINHLRDIWYRTSFLLDKKQSSEKNAEARYRNYKDQPLSFVFPKHFTGVLPEMAEPKTKAAVIREKGSNSEREMAYAMHLAGFEVKDVHMTDLISGRETLEDVRFIAAVGGFSNSDVLGSAKGWAGAFLYNAQANKALKDFFEREDTLSLGVCNGCQLFMELGLIYPDHSDTPKMLHNESGKFECSFTSVEILENHSVMLQSLVGSRLGIWAAHGEGKFSLPRDKGAYHIVGKYGYEGYPANPNGSDHSIAIMASDDGRHLVMMPHLERSTFPWNWAYYPKDRNSDVVSPWLEAFINAKEWITR